MAHDESAVQHDSAQRGRYADLDAGWPGAAARSAILRWAAGWAGTVVVAMTWLVSQSLGNSGDGGPVWFTVYLVMVLLYTLVPALLGLAVLLVPAVLGVTRTVPDWAVVVVATVVGGAGGAVLGVSVVAGALFAMIGTGAGLVLLRVRNTGLRWTCVLVTLSAVVVLGRVLPLV